MYRLSRCRGIKHQNIDRLIAEAQLKPGNQLQRFTFRFDHDSWHFNEQIDIATPCIIVCPRSEKLHISFHTENLPDGSLDDFDLFFAQPHVR